MESALKCVNYSLSFGLLVWIFLGLFTVEVSGYANGADRDLCANMTPSNADAQGGASPYSIVFVEDDIDYYSSSAVGIRIQGPAYEGILLQARANGSSDDTPLGTFSGDSLPADTKLFNCTADNDTVTHSTTTLKTNVTYEWIPGDVTDTIVFVATIWENETVFYVQLESEPLGKDPEDSISPTSTIDDTMTTSDDDGEETTTADDDDMETTSDDDDDMETTSDDDVEPSTTGDDDDDDMSTTADDDMETETESEDMETTEISPTSTDDTVSVSADVNETTTTTTTPAPTTPPVVEVDVPVSFSINETFTDALTNESSQEYKDQKDAVVGPLNETLSQTPGFVEIYNVRFTSGSIVVAFLVKYVIAESTPSSAVADATALQTKITNAVQEAITNGTLNLDIIANSLSVERKVTCPNGYILDVDTDTNAEECKENENGNGDGDDSGSVGISSTTHIVAMASSFLFALLFSR